MGKSNNESRLSILARDFLTKNKEDFFTVLREIILKWRKFLGAQKSLKTEPACESDQKNVRLLILR